MQANMLTHIFGEGDESVVSEEGWVSQGLFFL